MHQDHNLHWDIVAANLVHIHENPRLTPRRSDLFPRKLPSQTRSLHHFVRALVSAIQSFSSTERAKYPARFGKPDSGEVFADEFLSGKPSPIPGQGLSYLPTALNSQNQRIEYWIKSAGSGKHGYTTSNGDLADAVKELLAANQMSSLLMLAQHPRIPIGELRYLSWGHSFGFDYAASTALTAYIFFNVLEATPAASKCLELHSYKHVLHSLTCSGDYDAHTLPHRMFFRTGDQARRGEARDFDPRADFSALKDYLKWCFAILYKYDMLLKECGLDPNWEREIVYTLNSIWNFGLEYVHEEGT
jgi:hypothetical protein